MNGYKLIAGQVSEVRLFHLIKLANIKSENKRQALVEHLVHGSNQEATSFRNNIAQSTLSAAVSRLNKTYYLACKAVEG